MTLPPGDGQDPGPHSSDQFFDLVYDELRSIAHARMQGERSGQTIQTTELVHEAYLRLASGTDKPWQNRRHFFTAAAEAMRRILIERARAKSRGKRGGDSKGNPPERVSLDLDEVAAIANDRDPDLVLALDQLIERLGQREARIAQVVKLRVYAGLSVEEIAESMEVSTRTILRDWAFARAWLYGELTKG